MWFVNQKPEVGEYNPMHIHTNCKVSDDLCYLKKPQIGNNKLDREKNIINLMV